MKYNQLITALGIERMKKSGSYAEGDFHQAALDVAYSDWQEHDASLIHHVTVGYGPDRTIIKAGTMKQVEEWFKAEAEAKPELDMSSYRTELANGQSAWSYAEMLENAREKYGELFFILTTVGKYNQQVCNGGHIQYFDNGYADGTGGCFQEHDASLPLHREMVREFNRQFLPLAKGDEESGVLAAASKIMGRLRISIDASEEVDETCCDCCGSGKTDCQSCGGTGYKEGEGEDEECGVCGGEGLVECESCGGRGHCLEQNENRGRVMNTDLLGELDDAWYEIDDKAMRAINDVAARQCIALDPDAAGIYDAAKLAHAHVKECMSDPDHLMPTAAEIHVQSGPGQECYQKIADDNARYGYIEKVEQDGFLIGYRKSRVKLCKDGLYGKINGMMPGEEIDMLRDVSDKYDEPGPDGSPREDIRAACAEVIDYCVKYGRLEPVAGEGGNVHSYVRTAKK